ncbi:Acyl carrier protein [Lentzea waywayandensis]|uniref:Acyl carrier protein n=1 Tax=Lentzea waywayandensis TaxID=84724 RepID=A0A1I6FGP7_9PSEU|nr:acyl carrier protein [Lentzea waywayandensis]SFR29111.1 Acyl carrier protein [Lentzea waywayandensis]
MSDVLTDLVPLVAEVSGTRPHEVTGSSRFEQLAEWGSMAALRLLARVEPHWGVRLDLRRFLATETVAELAGVIAEERLRSA